MHDYAGEAHLHIPVADLVVYVVVVAALKPDVVGRSVPHPLFEVALLQTLPAPPLQAESVPEVGKHLLEDVRWVFLSAHMEPHVCWCCIETILQSGQTSM